MTSNSIASGATQTIESTPSQRVSDHATSRVVRDQVPLKKDAEDTSSNAVPEIPANVYNSTGEIVPVPSPPIIELLL